MRRTKILTTLVACALSLAGSPRAVAATGDDLPEIGSSAGATVSMPEERRVGRMIMRQLRESGVLLTDPLVNAYVQSVGSRLASHAHDGDHSFEFFVVDDPSLNAFALPGGYIGVHHGLILATADENELAGVLAHEIAHVTQRHIARGAQANGQTSMIATAAVMAALILGGLGGADGDAVNAAVMASQGYAMQQQINFTRANEYEADRVGIGILADAGFDPQGMPDFFDTMSRRTGLAGQRIPEFLRTHPVSSVRIAESRARAERYPPRQVASSLNYELARARLRVLAAEDPAAALATAANNAPKAFELWSVSERYAAALAQQRAGETAAARRNFEALRDANENVIAFHIGLAQAQIEDGDAAAGLATFADAARLFPRNVPLTTHYVEALVSHGDGARAHELMLDLVNNVQYTPEQVRLLALAASSAGDIADAHYYMSEFHVLNGQLQLAASQLQLALAAPELDEVQRARFAARLQQVEEVLRPAGRKPNARTARRPPESEPESPPAPE